MGHSLDGVLVERSRQYKALNAVEVNYKWKLHSEPDLGVPLAPSAMDVKSYDPPKQAQQGDEENGGVPTGNLHPGDEALLDWKGSMGDTAAENLKKRQDQLRAAARLALAEGKGRIPNVLLHTTTADRPSQPAAAQAAVSGKKAFSRVLDETMQSWMKKTTYLSNDYTRKVHDFKSLAETKQQQAQDLAAKQQQMSMRRSADAISSTFASVAGQLTHPTKKNLKPKAIMPILPNVDHWGYSYTHVVIDKPPNNLDLNKNNLNRAFVADVEERNNRMVCQLWVPPHDDDVAEEESDPEIGKETDPNVKRYRPIQQFDLDVIPLKEEDVPHANFCLWVDTVKLVTTYLPLSSRVQLSTGRPVKRKMLRPVARRSKGEADYADMKERIAEVDYDVAKKLGESSGTNRRQSETFLTTGNAENSDKKDDKAARSDSDDNDKGDDAMVIDGDKPAAATTQKKLNVSDDDYDSDDAEETFGGLNQTIIAGD